MNARLVLFGCLLTACLAAPLSGCAPQATGGSPAFSAPPMTLSDFYGFCSSAPTPNGCYSDPICQRYRREMAEAPPDVAGCLDVCRRLENVMYTDNLVNGCENTLDGAQDLCSQYCRRRGGS